MGADIHSRAEIYLGCDCRKIKGRTHALRCSGSWKKLGEIFPNTSTMRWVVPDRNYLDAAPDGVLLDAVDIYVRERVAGKEHYANHMVEQIPPGSELEKKVVAFDTFCKERFAWAREEGREQIQYDERGDYDPSGWARFSTMVRSEAAIQADLTEDEREALRRAILEHRNYTPEAWEEEGFAKRYNYDTSSENRIDIVENRFPEDDVEWLQEEPLDSRNYTLFSVLAGVRNSTDVTPISEPKGNARYEKVDGRWVLVEGSVAPEDASAEIKKFMDSMTCDGHSHSWLTLREIQDYEFGLIEYSGIVGESDYLDMKARGWPGALDIGPDTWTAGMGDGVLFSPEAYEKWIAINRPFVPKSHIGYGPTGPNVEVEDLPDVVEPPTAPKDVFLEAKPDLTYQDIAQIEKRLRGITMGSRYIWNDTVPLIWMAWEATLRDQMGQEFENMIDVFERLVEEHGITPDDVRVIFFFDN